MSARHRFNCRFFIIIILLSLFGGSASVLATDVKLAWEPSQSENIEGYKVYAGNSPGGYNSPIIIGNQTAYTVTGLSTGTWYFAVTVFDIEGNESGYSNEVSEVIGASDTTPPTISGVTSSSLTTTTVTIGWTTNEASDSQVEYGTTIAYGSSTTLNSSTVTSHSQGITGLAANTQYYYRVRSRDAAGNLAISGSYILTTAALTDMTPPTISGVTSSTITTTTATITWTTNEASNTQIEYGTMAGYGSSTALNNSMVTLHSQSLTNLAVDTLYHYCVRSRDAAGNLATSGDFTFTTGSGITAPVISGVTISNITNRSARISWITDKPSNSEIEYWTTNGTIHKVALSNLVTQHSMMLNNLRKQTVYHFTIQAVDSDHNQTQSSESFFTTLLSGSLVAALPRFAGGQDQSKLGEDILIGIALTNMGPDPATITFTARDTDGDLIAGQDIVNPRVRQLNPQTQSAVLDTGVFGDGFERSDSSGWIKLESNTTDAGGFFLTFNSELSLMDGTNLGETPSEDFIFTEIAPGGSTMIDIANNNPDDATVTINLISAEGSTRAFQSRTIKGNGALVADVYGELFPGIMPESEDYIRMTSTKGVQSFEMMRKGTADIASLTGQDVTAGGTTLYSPQYVVGGVWLTTLTVINLDSKAGTVQFQFVGEDGIQIGETRILQVPAHGKLFIDDPGFFQQQDPDKIFSGYVKIESDDIRLAGSTVFGDSNGQSFSSALPLIYDLQNSVLFSHVASNDLYFTGIAIVNPNDTDALPIIELYEADGTLVGSKEISLPAKQRKTDLLPGFFTSMVGKDQASGYIRILSEKPLASFVLFGTNSLSVLSAIPPQVIQ